MIKLSNTTMASVRGFNYQPSNGSNGIEIWERFSPELYRLELTRGKTHFPKMNAVRVWLSWDAWLNNPETFIRNFEKALSVLKELELNAVPVLFNGWFGYPSYGALVPELIAPYNMMMRPLLKRYVLEVIRAANSTKDHILVWDLCNEPLNNAFDSRARGYWREFLHEMREAGREADPEATFTVGLQTAHSPGAEKIGIAEWVDVFSLHTYYPTEWLPDEKRLHEDLDASLEIINAHGKPAIVTECCWGSLDDGVRAFSIRESLRIFQERHLGFFPHLLHHSLVADAHRPDYGPIAPPGYMAFIEADGSLRKGHGIFNDYC